MAILLPIFPKKQNFLIPFLHNVVLYNTKYSYDCGNSLCKRLEMIFKSCITRREFPSEWDKASVVLVHKKMTTNY